MPDGAGAEAGAEAREARGRFVPWEGSDREADPPRARRHVPLISTDGHLVEPPDLFEDRLPARWADDAPRIVDDPAGVEAWLYDGRLHRMIGVAAAAGLPIERRFDGPVGFGEMRRGAWDVEARIRDMDLDGIYASLDLPSGLFGFCGHRLQIGVSDPDLALATVRAYNDWQLEAWCAARPDRLIPCQIPWLLDPGVAAEEVRRNAGRGFRALSFSENPEALGLPSIHSGHWDPLLAACAETGTVVCLHAGSAGSTPSTSSDAPADASDALGFGVAMFAAVDWLYSGIPVRFPDLRICLSEGGIGWVAGLLDRLDHVGRYQDIYGTWRGIEITPRELMQRNFWFCSLDDRAAFDVRDAIGVENIVVGTGYPQLDSTWPDSQSILRRNIGHLPADEIAAIAWRNASDLFGHPVPDDVVADPERF